MSGKSLVECKTVIRGNRRRLSYYNNRTKKSLPIVVGKRGGLSVKSPNAKTRRYVKGKCTKNASASFWSTVKSLQKKANQ